MNHVILRLYAPKEQKHYEVSIQWPAFHLEEVYEIKDNVRIKMNFSQFVWALDMQLEELRVDPLRFPRTSGNQLVASIRNLIADSMGPIILQPRSMS